MSLIVRTSISLLGVALLCSSASAAELYRWVDANGQVHYGDWVPPAESKQGHETIGKHGVVTKVVPRELSGKELEQEQARLAAEQLDKDTRDRRTAYDRYLLVSFASVVEMQLAREQRLSALDARLIQAEAAVHENEKTLAELRSRTGTNPAEGALKTQIESFENSLIDNLKAVRKLRNERDGTVTQFADDIERFKGLKFGSIQQGD